MTLVTKREVLEYFVEMELEKPKYHECQTAWEMWKKAPDSKFYQLVTEWALSRHDVNPLLTYTIGTMKNKQHQRVRSWSRGEIDLSDLYSLGIRRNMKTELVNCQYNLHSFAHQYAGEYSEFTDFDSDSIPAQRSRLVVVKRAYKSANGNYLILDGTHRAISMIRNGELRAEAYIASYRHPLFRSAG